MKKFSFLLILAMGLALAACGDTEGTDGTEDTGGGTEDTGGGTEDGGEDAGTEDTDGTEDTEPPDEICDDGEDNDGDDAVDCADEDCAGTDACTEICDDEAKVDEDLDGFANCDDPDCADDEIACPPAECEPPFEPHQDGCELPIADPSEYVFGDTFSYINALSIPPRGTDAECCFDFSGDGDVDNGLALLVGALAVIDDSLDIQTTLAEALTDDSVTLLMEWKSWPDSPEFSVFLGTNDGDGDGEPDQAFEDRAAGNGIFQLDPSSFGTHGALIQFNRAALSEGDLVAGPSLFRLNIPIDTDGFALDLDLTIEQARIGGPITEIDTGIASVNPEFDIDGTMTEFGGMMLGGVVPLDQIFSLIDELARDCTCAGFNADEPVITYGDDGTAYAVACAQTPSGDTCTADDGVICENLSVVCSFLPSLPSLGLNDIDTDGNEVGDALSVGLRFSMTGADLGDPAIEPGG